MKQPLEQLVLDGLRRRYLTWDEMTEDQQAVMFVREMARCLMCRDLRAPDTHWEHYIIKAACAYRDLKDREQQT